MKKISKTNIHVEILCVLRNEREEHAQLLIWSLVQFKPQWQRQDETDSAIMLCDYRKFPKYSDTQNNCCNHSKI